MQASAATFSATPLGHKFVLRTILAKATANRCADCSEDIRAHSRGEVTDAQLLAVLNAQDDGKASVIVPGELSVGSYKAALRVCKAAAPTECVLNCAGHKLHDFLPPTRAGFDKLRSETPPRLYDLEWEDSEAFEIKLEEVLSALAWAREQVASGLHVVVNCAQGKSRSGLMAIAYLMAKRKLAVADALAEVQARRPLVQPNPAFMRALQAFAPELHRQPAPVSVAEVRLREAFGRYASAPNAPSAAAAAMGVEGLRKALIESGESANDATPMLREHSADGESLTVDEFVSAWLTSGQDNKQGRLREPS